MINEKSPVNSTFSIESLLRGGESATPKAENIPQAQTSASDETICRVVDWLDENHAFFAAALDGKLYEWLSKNTSENPEFEKLFQMMKNFSIKIKEVFANDQTKDIRAQFTPEPWGCFIDSISGIKDGGLRNLEIKSNEDNQLLISFLKTNTHIADFLDQELPKLNSVVAIWEKEQLPLVTNNVVNWLKENQNFFQALNNGTLDTWIEKNIARHNQTFKNIKVGILLPKHMTSKELEKKITNEEKARQGVKLNAETGYFQQLGQTLIDFQDGLDELFECINGLDDDKSNLDYLLLPQAELSEFLAENAHIVKYLEKNLPYFESAVKRWQANQNNKNSTPMNQLVGDSLTDVFAKVQTSLDQPPSIELPKRKAAEETSTRPTKRMTIYPLRG